MWKFNVTIDGQEHMFVICSDEEKKDVDIIPSDTVHVCTVPLEILGMDEIRQGMTILSKIFEHVPNTVSTIPSTKRLPVIHAFKDTMLPTPPDCYPKFKLSKDMKKTKFGMHVKEFVHDVGTSVMTFTLPNFKITNIQDSKNEDIQKYVETHFTWCMKEPLNIRIVRFNEPTLLGYVFVIIGGDTRNRLTAFKLSNNSNVIIFQYSGLSGESIPRQIYSMIQNHNL